VDFDIPAGFPTHRHVTAQESLENWGPLHVFDANGSQLRNLVSVCVSTGEVLVYGVGLVHHPAPLSVRPVTYDSPR
jgi:hypothetical protein